MPEAAETLTVSAGEVELACLAWGPPDGALALCLHGFPDTAWTWRRVAPRLAAAGWRVVAPFLRGYAPSGLALSGDYSARAYAADAVALHAALGADDRAVLIGHDWGAIATYLVAADVRSPFRRAVALSIPPLAALAPGATLRRAPRTGLRQLALSSYTLPLGFAGPLAERLLPQVIPRLWRRWSPGYDPGQDLPAVLAAVSGPDRRRAARLPYRTLPAILWGDSGDPQIPLLYLHGSEDGCVCAEFAELGAHRLPEDRFELIPDAGHFLALEAPEAVCRRIGRFLPDVV